MPHSVAGASAGGDSPASSSSGVSQFGDGTNGNGGDHPVVQRKSATRSGSSSAASPSPTFRVNGFLCKREMILKAEDFFFDGLAKACDVYTGNPDVVGGDGGRCDGAPGAQHPEHVHGAHRLRVVGRCELAARAPAGYRHHLRPRGHPRSGLRGRERARPRRKQTQRGREHTHQVLDEISQPFTS
ncbi:hypothetical protein ACP70R_037098 [Stipagrostis hirtigluma subsp. patula]